MMTSAESRLRQTTTHNRNARRRVSASFLACSPEHSRLAGSARFPHQSPSHRHGLPKILSRYLRAPRQTYRFLNFGPRFNTRLQFNDQDLHILLAV